MVTDIKPNPRFKPRKCIVKGCQNYSDGGQMIGMLCMPCYEMLVTGNVHHANPTFIGDMKRKLIGMKES
jgi:hypothetical protein